MLVAVKFLSDDVMKDTINYKNFLKQQKRNIYKGGLVRKHGNSFP